MNHNYQEQCCLLRGLSSEEAASWLMSEFPIESESYGDGIGLIACRTWKRHEQRRLACYYFSKIPYGNDRVYDVFFSAMSFSIVLESIKKNLPIDPRKKELLVYQLLPYLKSYARTEKHIVSSKELLETIRK